MQDPIQDVNDAAGAMPQDDELEALRGELEQLKAQSLLERADLENQRKRIAREIDSVIRTKYPEVLLISASAGASSEGISLNRPQLAPSDAA